MLLQPVYCRSAIRSHLLSNWWKIDTFAVCGTLILSVTPPSNSCALTPFKITAPAGASAGGSVPSAVGLSKFTLPSTVYLMADRYAAPMRVCGVACHSTPTFQPQLLSSPFTLAPDSRPAADPINVWANGASDGLAAIAACTPCAYAVA